MRIARHGRVVAAAVFLGVWALQSVATQSAVAAAHTTVGLYDYTSTPFSGSCSAGGSGTASQSTAEVTRTGSTVSVSIQLVGAQPNTTYAAGLLQAGSCLHESTAYSLSTDSNGNGTIQFTEQAAGPPGRNPLIVDVAVPVICPTPCTITAEPSPAFRSAVFKV
jgi:hypothetical protein